MTSRNKQILFKSAIAMVVILVIAALAGIHYVRHHLPAELVPDLRAAIAARNVDGADARLKAYLTNRYGSLDNATNREHAFEDFFNLNHMRAMRLIEKYSPPGQRLANIKASADWIQNYRQNLSPQERADLQSYFNSPAGAAALKASTAQFVTQDAEYRSAVVPVVKQLMTTLASVNQ